MILHMRTTLVLDPDLFRALKRIAADQGRTLSDVVQETLRRGLGRPERAPRRRRPALRSFSMGRPRVDLADRNQLFDVMDRG
jgi:hypothetical protein